MNDAELQRALELAYRYLNRRERTEHEVRNHLEQRDLTEEARDHVVRLLIEDRYLDDSRFARLFTQDKRKLDGWGRDRIRSTLVRRGIPREVAEEALEDEPPELERERAMELLRQRFPSPPRTRRERESALGLMLRRGYGSEVALEAITSYARAPAEPDFQ